ncbi:MAG TPA: hypothetical protein VFI68_07045 [Anaerolineales bacterium]|nr:hypothetical protein [Anaerolineales bacterium]
MHIRLNKKFDRIRLPHRVKHNSSHKSPVGGFFISIQACILIAWNEDQKEIHIDIKEYRRLLERAADEVVDKVECERLF